MINKKIASEVAVGIILIIAIAIGGIFWMQNKKEEISNQQLVTSKQEVPIQKQEKENTGIANPASTFCVQNGGKSEIRTNPDSSQTGYCVFANGSECEEWAYSRGECLAKIADETANWQIFKSLKYGYEIKYPNDWGVLNEAPSDPEKDLTLSTKGGKGSAWVTFSILDGSNQYSKTKSVNEWMKSTELLSGKVSTDVIFGEKGAVYRSEPSAQAPGNLMKYVVKNGIGYEVKILFITDADIILGEKVLATFKFTK